MDVKVNDEVIDWMTNQTSTIRNQYNTKCTEADGNDLTTWRNVGKGIYDYRASGDFRVVAEKSGNDFYVAAIYKHAPNRGKERVCGQDVPNY